MAKRDRSAVQIHLLVRNAKVAQGGDRLAGEGLVDLEDVNVLHIQLRPRERLARRRDGPDAQDLRRNAGEGPRRGVRRRDHSPLCVGRHQRRLGNYGDGVTAPGDPAWWPRWDRRVDGCRDNEGKRRLRCRTHAPLWAEGFGDGLGRFGEPASHRSEIVVEIQKSIEGPTRHDATPVRSGSLPKIQ